VRTASGGIAADGHAGAGRLDKADQWHPHSPFRPPPERRHRPSSADPLRIAAGGTIGRAQKQRSTDNRDMPMPPMPILLSVAMALAPLGPGQQARLAAWLDWAAAYRDCYEPSPFSLRIDEAFTARCIERTLQRQARGGSPEQRAATAALIAATPQLIAILNAPVGEPSGGKKTAPIDPAAPPRSR
jgi:hypothetical protein